MKKLTFLTLMILFFYGCDKESPVERTKLKTPNLDSLANIEKSIFESLSHSSNKLSNVSTTTYATDWSGQVQIVIITQEQYGQHNQIDVAVPQDYVLIGGGANVTPEQTHPGALLTASYPDPNLTTWHAKSKDHVEVFYHTLVAYAIGLKLTGVTRDELKNYIQIFTNTSSVSARPNTSVSVGSGYTLIGGGAQVNYGTGAGNLLVKSIPNGNTWYVKSKEHKVVCPASITAFAIGIMTTIPNFGVLEIGQESNSNWVSTGFGSSTVFVDNSWVVSCPGGEAQCDNIYGRLLCGIKPDFRQVQVWSKDHKYVAPGRTYAHSVKIRKRI